MSLYVILDRGLLSRDKILKTSESAMLGGADIIQLRDKNSSMADFIKTASRLKKITEKFNVPLVINDRADIALVIGAGGLHVGRGDIKLDLAKRLIGKNKILGISVKSLNDVRKAKAGGASYVGAGPVFKTPMKKGETPKGFSLLNRIRKMDIPFFAIGGIGLKNIRKLTASGFKDVAVIRAVCKSRNPYTAAKKLKEAVGSA